MMKLISRMIALLLCFAMVLSLQVTAFADSATQHTVLVSPVFALFHQSEIETDLQNLKEFGFIKEDVSVIGKKDGMITYRLNYATLENIYPVITVSKDSNDNKVLTITEGDLTDVLVISPAGGLYLNGGKMEIVSHPDNSPTIRSNELSISPRMSNTEYSSTPWFGPASNYTTFVGSLQDASVSTGGSFLADMTVTAIAGILSYIFSSSYVGVLVSILWSVANNIKSCAEQYAPDSAYLSYQGNYYEHDTQSMGGDRYYKYVVSYYSKKNYENYADSSTFYRHTYFT